jgi:hypothetical protein
MVFFGKPWYMVLRSMVWLFLLWMIIILVVIIWGSIYSIRYIKKRQKHLTLKDK